MINYTTLKFNIKTTVADIDNILKKSDVDLLQKL